MLLQKHLGKNENEKLDLHLCDLVIALIVIGIIFLTLYQATNHDFVEVSTESCCDGLIRGVVKQHLQLFEPFVFTFNSNIFLVIYLVFGDAQVYTGLALFLVS